MPKNNIPTYQFKYLGIQVYSYFEYKTKFSLQTYIVITQNSAHKCGNCNGQEIPPEHYTKSWCIKIFTFS